jgi:hypothetical protein
MSGIIVYDGPSLFDGNRVIAIATLITRNAKTGPMTQLWILPADRDPVAARRGMDRTHCGDCPAKPWCYVAWAQAPLQVWKTWNLGGYIAGPLPTHSPIRIGAAGDPAALPFEALKGLEKAPFHTGYTHAWRTCDKRWRRFLMASCDNPRDAADATRAGWRAFLTTSGSAPTPLDSSTRGARTRFVECTNAKNGTPCIACKLCDGAKRNAPSVWIGVHGYLAKHF